MTKEQKAVLVKAMTVLRELAAEHQEIEEWRQRQYPRRLAEDLEMLVHNWPLK